MTGETNTYPRGIEATVGAVVINEKNQVLMFKSPKWHNKYMFGGGHIEPGEKMFEACMREAKEEFGADIEIIELLHADECFIEPPQFKRKAHFVYFNILCKIKKNSTIILDNIELTTMDWLSVDEAIEKCDSTCKNTLMALKKRIEAGETFFE